MKLIEAEKVKRVMKYYWKAQVVKALTLTFTDGNEANKRINSYLEHNHELLKAIDELPSAEQEAPDINVGNMDAISRQQAIDAIEKHLKWTTIPDYYPGIFEAVRGWLNGLPSVQPERKDAVEKAVAVEAISDELMSRFDISATYAYEVAETAVNRIEMMAKEMGDR